MSSSSKEDWRVPDKFLYSFEERYGYSMILADITSNRGLEVLEPAIRENPEIALRRGCGGELPLHLAVEAGASVEVLQLLIGVAPLAAIVQTSVGNSPLHMVTDKTSLEALQVLLAAGPQAAAIPNRNRQYALHCAIMQNASEEVISAILAAAPQAAQEMDERRRQPLSLLLQRYGEKTPCHMVQALLAAAPDSVFGRDMSWVLTTSLCSVQGS